MNEAAKKPTFVNVGPGRCGTSWLYEMLLAHPEIAMSRIKETEYFNSNFDQGGAWYLDHFASTAPAIGEVSNMYYLDADVPTRIKAFDPDMKIIFNIRDPKSLLLSMVSFAARRGLDVDQVDSLLEEPLGKIMGSGWSQRQKSGTLTDGDRVMLRDAVKLGQCVERFQKEFPPEQIFFLVYERIESDSKNVLSELYAFLGVQPDFIPENLEVKINAAIEPRLKIMGKLATQISFLLRRIGAHDILTQLHRSALVKKLFYRGVESSQILETQGLPSDLLRELKTERAAMKKLIPDLSMYWEG